MRSVADIADWLGSGLPILDVRSPGEFAQGHIPGALELPLFTDAERAVVGTLYKQQGRDSALLEGLRIVGPKLATLVEQARAAAPDGRVRVHCWRGGERSGSVAWLLDKAGFTEVLLLRGGYKAFRTHVLSTFTHPMDLRVLGGCTGTGKTELLHHLRAQGEQVIDLEALARHKGSAFGAVDGTPQPTNEQFENALWAAWHACDPERPIWVEDESRMIGRVKVPDPLFDRMQQAPLLFVERTLEERTARLVTEYGGRPTEALAEAIRRVAKRLGPQHAKAALEALQGGDLHSVASVMLGYYDKTYRSCLAQRDPERVITVHATDIDMHTLTERLIDHAHAFHGS